MSLLRHFLVKGNYEYENRFKKHKKQNKYEWLFFFEYAQYFSTFNNKILCLNIEDELICIRIQNSNLPHLIGLQYAYDKKSNKSKYKGEKGFQLLLNDKITLSQFKNRVKRNNIVSNGKKVTWDMILNRIEWLPYFFNNITKKPQIKKNEENSNVKTSMKEDYFYYKIKEKEYLILSLLKVGKTYSMESFIVYDNIRFLGNLPSRNIKEIYWSNL